MKHISFTALIFLSTTALSMHDLAEESKQRTDRLLHNKEQELVQRAEKDIAQFESIVYFWR